MISLSTSHLCLCLSVSLLFIIRWWHDPPGFGIIETPDGEELHVDYPNIETTGFRTLHKGDEVYTSLNTYNIALI